MKKIVCTLLIIALLLTSALFTASCDKKDTPAADDASPVTLRSLHDAEDSAAPTISDYTVAEEFDLSTIRFAFYSPATGWVEDVENAPFDESRPTVIHSHGQGGDGRMFTPDTLYEAGYNVMSFLWGSFSNDGDVIRIEQRIWQKIESYAKREGDETPIVAASGFNCTVPELFVARYCDFFRLHPDYDLPIRLGGHSYGGQLTFALATYFTTLYLADRLPARLLPERYMLLDPYFDNFEQTFDCAWLDAELPFSSVGAAIYCLENVLEPYDVPVEMLRTSNLVEMAGIMGIMSDEAPDYFSQMKPRMRVVELGNKNDLRDQFDTIEGSGFLHTVANDFYYSPNAYPLYADENDVTVFGRENSASLILASRGMHFDFYIDSEDYRHYENVTVTRLVNKTYKDVTVVGGLISLDRNGNGVADEKAYDRLASATVTLTDKATGEQQTAKVSTGYYQFGLERGGAYTLTVEAAGCRTATKEITADDYLTIADFAMAQN